MTYAKYQRPLIRVSPGSHLPSVVKGTSFTGCLLPLEDVHPSGGSPIRVAHRSYYLRVAHTLGEPHRRISNGVPMVPVSGYETAPGASFLSPPCGPKSPHELATSDPTILRLVTDDLPGMVSVHLVQDLRGLRRRGHSRCTRRCSQPALRWCNRRGPSLHTPQCAFSKKPRPALVRVK